MNEKCVSINNAEILFRNFEGRETKFNAKGSRTFCVKLAKELADQLREEGWNIKQLKVQEGSDEEPQDYVQVTVSYKYKPPKIVVINGKSMVRFGEESVSLLDWAEIENVDIILRPSAWEVNNASGVKAYLKAIYVTLEQDEFSKKYEDFEEDLELSTKPPWDEDEDTDSQFK